MATTTKKTTPKKTATKATAKKATPKKKAASKKTTGKTPAAKTNGKQADAKKPATKKTPTGDKKMSALDAAAKVLGEAKEPLNTKTMIERMSAKGYWTSPGGKTPHATLYAAILREINVKGKEARFAKADRGLFTLTK
jgi:hypothetical protein